MGRGEGGAGAAHPPLISVITICKNNLAGLRATRASLLNQIFPDAEPKIPFYEWIVIDGASSDGTLAYLSGCPEALWQSAPDFGVYDAMNAGIARAGGRYLWFLNAGDCVADPWTVARLCDVLDRAAPHAPDFLYGDSREGGHVKPARLLRGKRSLCGGLFTHHQAMLYGRAMLGDLRYDLRYRIAADYDLTVRYVLKLRAMGAENPCRTVYLPFAVCDFQPGGLSQCRAAEGRREQAAIRRALNLCGRFENGLITAGQAAVWTGRRLFPALYWHLKSCGNSAHGTARNQAPASHPETPLSTHSHTKN